MPTSSHSIFADPRGRRRRWMQITALILISSFLSASTYFISSLLVAPTLGLPQKVRSYRVQLKKKSASNLPSLEMKNDWRHLAQEIVPSPFPLSSLFSSSKTALLENKTYNATNNFSTLLPIRLGYVATWDPESELSLKHHAPLLTHVATEWFNIVGVEKKLIAQHNESLHLFCQRKGLGFLPILRNLDGNTWQSEAVEDLLRSPESEQNNFINNLLHQLPSGATGLLLEWNEIDPSYRQEITQFLTKLAEQLHKEHHELWVTIPLGKARGTFDVEKIGLSADHFVTSLYDQHCEADDTGPLADMDWFQEELKPILSYGKPAQWIIGLGTYGTDWNQTQQSMESVSFVDVMARADLSTAGHVTVEAPHFSPHFNYLSGPDGKEDHEVWFLDAITFFNELQTITPYHLGGVALYRLGQEDPDIWKALQLKMKIGSEHRSQPTEEELETFEKLSLKNDIASIGYGDFLTAGEESSDGWRAVTPEDEIFISSVYEEFPRPECIYRQGAAGPHQVALTFDDGPDPTWTPRILKILKEKQTLATFFVLGSQAQQFPDLLQRIQREGHEIGNHTYTHQNLGETSDEQICLELNATTRLIESITGHSTSLFRPPFNGDGNPSTPGELRALRMASDLGYLTVGQSIDPDDWELPGADTIVEQVKEQRSQGGSIILLHDAGGNRSQTVAALPRIIDYLHARGDEIVPLATLIGLPKEILIPPLRQSEVTMAMHYIYGSFVTLRFLETAGWTLLVVATILALLRVFFFFCCALRHRERENRRWKLEETNVQKAPLKKAPIFPLLSSISEQKLPPLSILIAAYNEEKVITSTLEHLIKSDYKAPLELIIIDDGSRDKTSEVIDNFIKSTSDQLRTIVLIKQTNTGKSTALNRALEASHHALIVTLDADTMVTPHALKELIIPFANSRVGAVSGHIRVGNPKQWLGRFQQIEY